MLGVVENMAGLRQPAAAFRFSAPQAGGGDFVDVTDRVLHALRSVAPDLEVCHPSSHSYVLDSLQIPT